MRPLSQCEVKQVDGAWLGLAISAARLGYAIYKHSRRASAATWAAKNVATVSATYQAAKYFGADYHS